MTIGTALNNAMSGLRAAGRATDVIANNISNANTPGYARRVMEQSATTLGNRGGVNIDGIVRMVDPGLLSARRTAQADMGYSEAINGFNTGVEATFGTPDDPSALTNLIADFDAALLTASSRPDASERLTATVESAKLLAASISSASQSISDMRTAADASIDAQITRLNAALGEMEQLNTQIAQVRISGQDDSALRDLRQNLVDEIHEMVPVREAARDNGKVALYSEGGLVLLDGSALEIDFTTSRQVTPYMTHAGGQLSGLSVNGLPISIGERNSDLPGGTIAAQFAVRDALGEDALTQIDAVARNLIERFQDPTVDPTLAPGDAGLFTDDGLFFDTANETGIAERLVINSSVDPARGGEAWRIRDGVGATAPGAAGQSALLDTFRAALLERTAPASGDFGPGVQSMSDVANNLLGRTGVLRLSSEQSLSFAASAYNETAQAERANGVDTDSELQRLILVEQNYAANARMIETINRMMDTLMRIAE